MAIAAGNPTGGAEVIHKASKYDWLAEDATEKEILASQQTLAQAGFFVEPSSATTRFGCTDAHWLRPEG
jgi:threonine synthase